MGSPALLADRGYFSLVQYVSDVARREPRNVGVWMVASDGFQKLRTLPPSRFSPRLQEQGLVDALLSGLAAMLESTKNPSAGDLLRWAGVLTGSIQISEPRPALILGDPSLVIEQLYRTLVAPVGRPVQRLAKAEVLDRVVQSFRSRGAVVRRSSYLNDFVFDAIVEPGDKTPTAVEVLSFAVDKVDWTRVERDAGHFLFAISRVAADPLCVVQPPSVSGEVEAKRSHDRIRQWLDTESIPVLLPGDVSRYAASLGDGRQLQLMAIE